MKQLLITLSTIAILVDVACACSFTKNNNNTDEMEMEIYEIEYENHTFFVFSEYGKSVGVLHAPNCNCFNK